MHILIKKSQGKLNVALALVALVAVGFGSITYILASDHTATQEASSAKAETINIVAKTATTTVSTITFPQGAPNATISDPSNNIDGVEGKQVLGTTDSEPVVRLQNASGGNLKVHLEITTWTDSIAASQRYKLVTTDTTNVDDVDVTLSANGNAATVDTTVTIGEDEFRALYLELTLSGVADKTGTSTLTILGETP